MSFSHSQLASSSAHNQGQTQAVALHVHAPEFSGFTHTIKSRFTYFSADEGSMRNTFGMPTSEFALLMNTFVKDFLASEVTIQTNNKSLPPFPDKLKRKLNACLDAVNDFDIKLKKKQIFQNSHEMAQALIETGHIPLMLTKAAAAKQYKRSTRSINASDLETYYKTYPLAQPQAVEYLVKQGMMQKVAELYRETSAFRNTIPAGNPDYIACTRLMTKLNKEIIEVNEATLPAEYVQFDLYNTFIEKLHDMICQINPKLVEEQVIDNLMRAINHVLPNQEITVTNQKNVSEQIYRILKSFFEQKGLGVNAEITIDKQLDAILQEVLPIAAYMNSQFNPFNQDSVFGALVVGEFHSKALAAYRLHESRHPVNEHEYQSYYPTVQRYPYKYTPTERSEEYDTDQMEKILFPEIAAPDQKATQSTAGGFLASLRKAWLRSTDGSQVQTVATSESRKRRLQLALPAAPVQLLIMPPGTEDSKEEKKSGPGYRI
jgi:hypothetical protein